MVPGNFFYSFVTFFLLNWNREVSIKTFFLYSEVKIDFLWSRLRSGAEPLAPADNRWLLRSLTELSNLENFLLRSAPTRSNPWSSPSLILFRGLIMAHLILFRGLIMAHWPSRLCNMIATFFVPLGRVFLMILCNSCRLSLILMSMIFLPTMTWRNYSRLGITWDTNWMIGDLCCSVALNIWVSCMTCPSMIIFRTSLGNFWQICLTRSFALFYCAWVMFSVFP